MNIANNILRHNLKNVYFLCGTACGGKTTAAKELSKRYASFTLMITGMRRVSKHGNQSLMRSIRKEPLNGKP